MSLNDFIDHDDVSEIVSKLKKADEEYYNKSKPSFSDAQYDKLKDQLRNADPDNPYLSTVGAPLPESTAWKKRKHKIPMASLDKCNESGEFIKWTSAIKQPHYFIIEDKLDGISIDIEYNKGALIAAITRGDGETGQDILTNVLNMQNVKKKIPDFTGNIRGEIVITKPDFHELCKHEDFKNARNAASGIATRLDGKYAEYLTIFFYDIIEEGEEFQTEYQKIQRIGKLGMKTSQVMMATSVEEVVKIMERYVESVRTKRPYDIDAIVVKADSLELQEEMGRGNNGNPKGQIAWKFPNETAVTTLKDIEWSMGRNGQITPVAIFEPTFVAGGMLARASLGSYGEFKNLKLHKGDTIEISRRNDVIPHVEKVIKASNNPVFKAPSKCPVCGKALEIGDKKIHCKNKSCSALGLGDLMTWVKALDIKGLGPALVEKLFNAKVVTTPIEFYTADGFKLNKEMSEKVTKKIWEQFYARMELPLDVFIDGLNIENFGGSTTRSLIKQGYDTLEKILALSKKQLSETEGIGDIKAEQVCEGLKAKRTLIEQLFYVGISIASPVKKKTGLPLSGKTILFTGTMSKGRKEMSAEAESFGAEVVERVSKDLSMLIVPDKAWVSDKTQKAKKLGIQTLTEGEYRKLV